MPVNTDPRSGRFGQTYGLQPAPGGVYHVYPDGTKQFVKAGAPQPAADPGIAPAAQWMAAAQATGTGPAAPGATPPPNQWDAAAKATGTGPYAPPPPSLDPRDATYWGEDAASRKQRDDALAGNEAEGTLNKKDFDEALRRLRADRPGAEANVATSSNKSGLFYSSNRGNRLDELATDFARREGDIRSGYDRSEAARNAARTAIENGYGIEDAARLGEAAGRQIGRDTAAADSGALVRNPQVPAFYKPLPLKPFKPRRPRRRP